MIRLAQAQDLPQLKRLWMQAFHDSPEATDFYFTHRNRYEDLLVDMAQEKLRGMLSLLPLTLRTPGGDYAARYFFAIATDEASRGQGISTRLIQAAEALTLERGGAAAVLVPAGEDLFHFYGKRGYSSRFSYQQVVLRPEDLPPCPADTRLLPCTAADMLRLRDKMHTGSALYARWDEAALRYVELAASTYEAPLLRFIAGGGEGYAYCEWDDDALVVKDLALQGMGVHTAAAILHRELNAKAYVLRLPEGTLPGGKTVPFGMWKPLSGLPLEEGAAPFLSLGKD